MATELPLSFSPSRFVSQESDTLGVRLRGMMNAGGSGMLQHLMAATAVAEDDAAEQSYICSAS